ncbi:MAG: glycerophosphodiester phosphodiesterase family protein [Lapillicoccus sp.]
MIDLPRRDVHRLLLSGLALSLAGCSASGSPAPGSPAPGSPAPGVPSSVPRLRPGRMPVIYGHRGAPGYRPEETLASFELGVRLGADVIELDLVPTKDHVLVARHDNEMSGTTDVARHPEFASRMTRKRIDGKSVSGWFTEDFTLAELQTLRARERLPQVRPGNTDYDGRFPVPTFEEVLDLRARLSTELGRPVGIAPETKHPSFFSSIGLPIETPMVQALRAAGLDSADAPVLVQSFELVNLLALRTDLGLRARTIFLIDARGRPASGVPGAPADYDGFVTPAGLAFLAGKVDAIGPEKSRVIPLTTDYRLDRPTDLVRDAHAAGLEVVPWTFRAENQFLPVEFWVGTEQAAAGRAAEEQVAFLRTGIDGLFTDQADISVRARASFLGG